MSRFISFTYSNRACPLLLICSCIYFCPYGPFNCISFHKFPRELSAFSLCSSGLISALSVLSATYLFMKVSLSPDIIFCGWPDSKHQLPWILWACYKKRDSSTLAFSRAIATLFLNGFVVSISHKSISGLVPCATVKQVCSTAGWSLFYSLVLEDCRIIP